jgi:ligand-binding SRPBCC domain-containing protein
VPAPLLRLRAGELATVMLASQRVVPRAAQHLGMRFRHPELRPALDDLCADLDPRIDVEQWVPLPPAEVFPFYANAINLERITPPFLRFRVHPSSGEALRDGTLIDYRLRLHGIPVGWRSRIESWRPDGEFVDRQVRGPYALWHHRHTFEPYAGGTLVRDRVRYRLPFGALGELLAGRLVARDLERIFAYRRDAIAAIFAAPTPEARRRAS